MRVLAVELYEGEPGVGDVLGEVAALRDRNEAVGRSTLDELGEWTTTATKVICF